MVLDNIRQQIENAIRARARYKDLVNGKVEVLNGLKAKLKDCLRQVEDSELENKAVHKEKLHSAIEAIEQILSDAAPLINRFNRDTINLGVAGATQAGKSTLLQAISGVKLPRAGVNDPSMRSGDSTTAAKSIIINSPEKRGIVFFRDKNEFVEFVKSYLPEKYRNKVQDINDFKSINLQAIKEDNDITAGERDEVLLLIDAQKSFGSIEKYLGSEPKDINLADLADYVPFFESKDEQHRYWPVVKLVEIRCPFVQLGNPDIKLTLVDLPGMGQSKRIDEQMVSGLENEVDTVLLLFKISAPQPARDSLTFDAIKGAQKFLKDKTKFLSFYINVVENDEDKEGHIHSTEVRIKDNFTRSNEKYATYKTPVMLDKEGFNSEKVHQDIVDVLTKLVGDIDSLDSDTYNGWLGTLDVDGLKKQLSEIANQLKQDVPLSQADDIVLQTKRNAMIEKLADFNDLEDDYNYKLDGTDGTKGKEKLKEIRSKINGGLKRIANSIDANPLNNDNWDQDFIKGKKIAKGTDGVQTELMRLWTYIRHEYLAIENVANECFVELKNDVIDKFNELVGKEDFITERGDDGIKKLLDKISDEEEELPFFTDAFKSLLNEKISFNQNAYQLVVDSGLAKSISSNKDRGGRLALDDFNGKSLEESKKLYTDIVHSVNNEMMALLADKTPETIAAFLYGKLEYFNDCLNRTSFSKNEKDIYFYKFCKAFCLELWPDVFGQTGQMAIARRLTETINEIKAQIEKLTA